MKEIALYKVFTVGSGIEITVLTIMIVTWAIALIFNYFLAFYLHFFFKRNVEPRLKAHKSAKYAFRPESLIMRVGMYTLCIFFQRYRDRLLVSYPLHKKVPFRIKAIAALYWFVFFFWILNLAVGSVFLSYVE
jgi:hypothetical protein